MPVRKVLLDAFGTIFSPSKPVHEQYALVARQYGIHVESIEVKNGFKKAFADWSKRHPLYGKLSSAPLSPYDWWSGVIRDTFKHAGADSNALDNTKEDLVDALIRRFQCREGYELHDDVKPFLRQLASHGRQDSLSRVAVVSGSDRGIVNALHDLGVAGDQGISDSDVFTTWDIEAEKSSKTFWTRVLARLNNDSSNGGIRKHPLAPSDILVIGDEFIADYETPKACGMNALILKRPGTSGHARPTYSDEAIEGQKTDVISSLTEVLEWIRRNGGVGS